MGSDAIGPLKFPWVHDVVQIGGSPGILSPGYCILSGWNRTHEFDVKKGKGTKGSTITFVGLPPGSGEIEFFIWDDGRFGRNHFEEWAAFVRALKYDPTKKNIEAIPIYHPFLDDLGINSVVCTEIGILTRSPTMMFSSKCKFLEYTPQPKGSAVGTAKGSKKITPKEAAANQAAAAGDAATNALKEALSAPSSQEQEMDKLWKQYNSEGEGATQ
jgi:hypothetical protein